MPRKWNASAKARHTDPTIRGQGQRHHPVASLQGRTVCRPCRSAPRQPIPWPHAGHRHPGDGGDDRHTIERAITDAEYRGHTRRRITSSRSTPPVKCAASPPDQREMKRRSAVEPVIGHLKAEHRMGRNHLAPAPATPSTPCSPPPATLPPPAQLAEAFVARLSRSPLWTAHTSSRMKIENFTDDHLE